MKISIRFSEPQRNMGEAAKTVDLLTQDAPSDCSIILLRLQTNMADLLTDRISLLRTVLEKCLVVKE
jgi:hypothetical protein